MAKNPYSLRVSFINDLEDFKMPYGSYTPTDQEVMKRRYQELNNYSHGAKVRLISRW